MEAIGIGDLHLSSTNGYGGFSKFVQSSDEYILSEVQRVIDSSTEEGINTVFIYGDICDAPRMSYNAHSALLDFFEHNKDCNFHLILGNHDKLAVDSDIGHSCQLLKRFNLPNVNIYEQPTVVDFGDCKVNFMSYPYSDFKPKMLNVCHLDLNGAKMDNGRLMKTDVSSKKYHVVSGHIHSSGSFANTYYSGTLYQLNFGESVKRKGYHKITCVGSDVDVVYVPFKPKYTLQDIVVSESTNFDTFDSKTTFYRLIVPGNISLNPDLYAKLKIASVKTVKSDIVTPKDLELDIKFESLNLNTEAVLESMLSSYSEQEKANILEVRSKVLKNI